MKKRKGLVVLFDHERPMTDDEADRRLGLLSAILGDDAVEPSRRRHASRRTTPRVAAAPAAHEAVLLH